MEVAWSEMKRDISLANKINTTETDVVTFHEKLQDAVHTAVSRCRVERKRKVANAPVTDLSDETLRAAARHTDRLPLADYDGILHLVPRLVNVVTVRPWSELGLVRARKPLRPPDRPGPVLVVGLPR